MEPKQIPENESEFVIKSEMEYSTGDAVKYSMKLSERYTHLIYELIVFHADISSKMHTHRAKKEQPLYLLKEDV